MADEKRLIDANALMEQVNNLCSDGNENWIGTDNNSYIDHADVVDIISDAPTVDAVEVVRCKDCKCFEKMTSNNSYFCNVYGGFVKEEDYCSRAQTNGKRREGE